MKRLFLILSLTCFVAFFVASQSAQSDSLFAKGVELYNAGKYKEAIHYYCMAYKYAYKTNKQISNELIASLLICIDDYMSSLNNKADAIRIGKEALEIRERLFGKEHPDYATTLSNLANCNYSLGNYAEAIRLCTEALEIRERVLGKDHPDYATSLNNLALYNSSLGNYTEAIRLGTKALEIEKVLLSKEHPLYATTLNNLACCNYSLGNYAEAIRLGTEALEIRERVLGKDHPDYASSLNNLALYNSSLGNYTEAIRLGTKALEIEKVLLSKEHPLYATTLNNLACCNSSLGNYAEAIRLGTEALEIRERVLGKDHPDYAKTLGNIATYNSSLGNYAEAIRLGTEALEIRERVLGKDHPDYAISLNNLADCNSSLGNYAEAIRLGTEALKIRERVLGKNHPDYVTSLNNLAVYNNSMGNYAEAVRLGTEALEICMRFIGKEQSIYATTLSNLSAINRSLGYYTEAVRLETEALAIRGLVLGNEHPDFALTLSNLAVDVTRFGKYDEALRLSTSALEIYKHALGKEHPLYAKTLGNIATYNSYLNNYAEAIRLGTEALEIRERVLGKDHPDYAYSLKILIEIDFIKGNYSEAISYSTEYFDRISRIIRSNFAQMTEFERNMFWNKYEPYLNNRTHELAYRLSGNDILEVGYNSALLSKGVLLKTSQEMKQLILNSEDETILALYNDFSLNRLMLNRLYEKPIAERHLDTDSLEQVTNSLERELIAKSKTYGDYTRNMTINWHDVQAKLSPRDVCIEFVSFAVSADSTMYAAYLLKKDMAGPVLVPLFEQKQLPKADKLYTTSSMAQLVWKPLSQYLDGVDNIYFAPSGELYNIAIEYVPSWDGDILMSEKWNIHRLSSTRELALNKEKTAIKQSAIFGGIKYDTNANQLLANSKKYPSGERSLALQHVILADSLNMRDGVSELSETKIEAEEIGRTLSQKSVKSLLRTDTVATEGEFKHLSKQKINLMHIATHGFYWTEHEAKFYGNQLAFLSNDDRPRYEEDKALTRSGLLMAGANNALKGERLPEGVDDGILTAKEISQLELKDLDLVVLSACQTGLGEIKGDGVFGLQRGFKKAGANSIMMSLWKVDDTATRMLMTQFYKNLTSGMSKHESLKQAQKYLREYEVEVVETKDSRHQISAHAKEQAQQDANKEKTIKKVKKYQDPYYWAGFILLDALN